MPMTKHYPRFAAGPGPDHGDIVTFVSNDCDSVISHTASTSTSGCASS